MIEVYVVKGTCSSFSHTENLLANPGLEASRVERIQTELFTTIAAQCVHQDVLSRTHCGNQERTWTVACNKTTKKIEAFVRGED